MNYSNNKKILEEIVSKLDLLNSSHEQSLNEQIAANSILKDKLLCSENTSTNLTARIAFIEKLNENLVEKNEKLIENWNDFQKEAEKHAQLETSFNKQEQTLNEQKLENSILKDKLLLLEKSNKILNEKIAEHIKEAEKHAQLEILFKQQEQTLRGQKSENIILHQKIAQQLKEAEKHAQLEILIKQQEQTLNEQIAISQAKETEFEQTKKQIENKRILASQKELMLKRKFDFLNSPHVLKEQAEINFSDELMLVGGLKNVPVPYSPSQEFYWFSRISNKLLFENLISFLRTNLESRIDEVSFLVKTDSLENLRNKVMQVIIRNFAKHDVYILYCGVNQSVVTVRLSKYLEYVRLIEFLLFNQDTFKNIFQVIYVQPFIDSSRKSIGCETDVFVIESQMDSYLNSKKARLF